MKIKYVSYVGGNMLQSQNKTHEIIIEKLSSLNTNTDGGFEFCTTHEETLKTLGASFADSDVIVLLIDIAEYNKTKSLLFKAMNLKCIKNNEVISKIRSFEYLSYLNEKQIFAHSAMPLNSQAFITKDGLFSGFGIESDEQKMVVLPIDEMRVDDSLLEEVFAFLGGAEEQVEELAEEPTEETFEEPEEEPEKDEGGQVEDLQEPEYEEEVGSNAEKMAENYEPAFVKEEKNQPLYGSGNVDNLVAETLTNIGYSQIKIAFGVQKDNVIVDDFFRSKIVFRNTGLFTIVNVNKTALEDDEHKCKADLSQIARSSMLNANASIGMAVSEVMTDEDGKAFVLSAMCDAKKTNIYKVYALPEEDDRDLMICAIGNMFGVLNERVTVFNERMRQKNSDNVEKQKKQKNNKSNGKKSKVPLIVLIVILVLVLAAVAVVAFKYFYNGGGNMQLVEKVKDIVFLQTNGG